MPFWKICLIVTGVWVALSAADTFGYVRGLERSNELHAVRDNELRIQMMGMNVCQWTLVYREKMGCTGVLPKSSDPFPHIPSDQKK